MKGKSRIEMGITAVAYHMTPLDLLPVVRPASHINEKPHMCYNHNK